MTRIVTLVSSISILFILLDISYRFIRLNSVDAVYDLIAFPLNWFTTIPTSFHLFSFLITIAILIYNLFNHQKVASRALSFIAFFFCISLLYNNGKIDHDLHAFIFIGLFMCFYNTKQNLTETWNLNILRLTQGTLLFHYFLSGTWKVRKLLSGSNINFNDIAIHPIAVGVAEGSVNENIIYKYLLENLGLLKLGFIVVILFQISCIIPIYKKKYYRYWAIAALLFHLSTELTIGIRFGMTRYAVLIALILFEELVELESQFTRLKTKQKHI